MWQQGDPIAPSQKALLGLPCPRGINSSFSKGAISAIGRRIAYKRRGRGGARWRETGRKNRRSGEGGCTCTDVTEKEEKEGCGRTGLKTTVVVRGVSSSSEGPNIGSGKEQQRRKEARRQRAEEGGPVAATEKVKSRSRGERWRLV
ncbi:hypothetical protein Syun_007179 [Stephania yunnanensis]|uniref:Uncharacterized protein n=1 Tax=Stephania yunnanensis TaxID=152371 RepID=A0AAP0PYE7_9MAGN